MGTSRPINQLSSQLERLRTQLTLPTREIVAWLFGRRKRFTVRGGSMFPLFREGEDVLVQRLKPLEKLAVGELVLAEHPNRPDFWLVKQVGALLEDGQQYMLEGLNPMRSTDSRHFGAVSRQLIQGRVTAILG